MTETTGEPVAPPILTPAEHHAIDLAGQLANTLAGSVIGDGPTRHADLVELVNHVHAIQHAVMAQAAARVYPDRYRLLGGVVPPEPPPPAEPDWCPVAGCYALAHVDHICPEPPF